MRTMALREEDYAAYLRIKAWRLQARRKQREQMKEDAKTLVQLLGLIAVTYIALVFAFV